MISCYGDVLKCVQNANFTPDVTSSPCYSNKYLPEYVLNDTDDKYFNGNFTENVWWKIDFKAKVYVSSYKIRAKNESGWIYNWEVEVSNDDKYWKHIHTIVNRECSSFPSFDTKYRLPFRYFRINGTGPSALNYTHNVAFSYIQFLNSKRYAKQTSKIRIIPFSFALYFYDFLL